MIGVSIDGRVNITLTALQYINELWQCRGLKKKKKKQQQQKNNNQKHEAQFFHEVLCSLLGLSIIDELIVSRSEGIAVLMCCIAAMERAGLSVTQPVKYDRLWRAI